MHNLFLSVVAAALFSMLVTPPVLALDEFRVTGVAAGDSLNMRKDVAEANSISDVPVIGAIPSNGAGILATGVTVKYGSAIWREVRYRGVTGWVNTKYLKRIRRRYEGILPGDMDCEGTEPFWSLKIRGDQAVYEHETAIRYSVAARTSPANRNTVMQSIILVRQGPGAERIALVREESCDTGMSAHDFPFSALILGAAPDTYDFGPFMGCCSMPR